MTDKQNDHQSGSPVRRLVGRLFIAALVMLFFAAVSAVVRVLAGYPEWVGYIWYIPSWIVASHYWDNLYSSEEK
jgi:hypothetical protein